MSVVLVTISSDPRFILARPAFYTSVAGIYRDHHVLDAAAVHDDRQPPDGCRR